MYPLKGTGVAIGGASVACYVFDQSIQMFKFISSMVDFPKDCERCRLQLMIECERLRNWGDIVGLVDVPDGAHIASCLGTNALELCSIIVRVNELLEAFIRINSRWKAHMVLRQPTGELWNEKTAAEFDLGGKFASLETGHEDRKDTTKPPKGAKSLLPWWSKRSSDAKEAINHLTRIRWVTVDQKAFETLLREFRTLTNRIHELMDDHRSKQIHDLNAKTHRQIVMVHDDLTGLKNMLDAINSVIEIDTRSNSASIRRHSGNNETLRDLLTLKQLKRYSAEILDRNSHDSGLDIDRYMTDMISVHRYDSLSFRERFTQIQMDEISPGPARLRGAMYENQQGLQVWVEWKTAVHSSPEPEEKKTTLRIATLAQMLADNKPDHLYAPTCVGYVHDRAHNPSVGWIFRMPAGSNKHTILTDLHSLLGQTKYMPTPQQRTALAWKLASSILYLHSADWLHKNIHSGSVLFTINDNVLDTEQPILSGFEYSRPQSSETTSRSEDPKWDIYRWPCIQNDVPRAGASRKTYDIYSLGLMLLEIAHWKPLHELMVFKKSPAPHAQASRVRSWLLEEETFAPFKNSNPLNNLRNIIGNKYWAATRRCLTIYGDEGLSIQEDQDAQQHRETGIRLQDAFSELVVDQLKSVSLCQICE